MSDTAQKSVVSPDLAQIFGPIREDLEAVEQEFVRHIQSRVALIPEMGRYIQKSGGKRNEPAFVARVAETVAALRGVPAAELAAQMTRNFDAFFGPTVSHQTA